MSKRKAPLLQRVFKWFPKSISMRYGFSMPEPTACVASIVGAARTLGQTAAAAIAEAHLVRNWVPHIEQLEVRQMPATRMWAGGGGDNNWTTAANWSGGVVPTTSDSVVISSVEPSM